MIDNHVHSFHFKMEDQHGNLTVQGEITGEAKVPNHDDLKFKAIIALLNSIDKQNFIVSEKMELFNSFISEIGETLDEVEKYESFQGNNIKSNDPNF